MERSFLPMHLTTLNIGGSSLFGVYMVPLLVIKIYGYAAYLSATAVILTFITGILFFSFGQWFGKLNDLFSVFQVMLMIPLILMFNQLMTPPRFSTILITTTFGLGGILISAYGQIRLLLGKIDFEESLKYFPATGAIGFWLIMVNLSSFGSSELPKTLLGIGIAAGVGYLLTVGGFIKGGQQDPLFYSGTLVLGVCYPIWGFWMGRIILASLA